VKNVFAILLAGGEGTRLFPLTKDRAKPAVPFAGKYRIVDVPISNCINSGFRRIYILTQFNSTRCTGTSRILQIRPVLRGLVKCSPPSKPTTRPGEGTADAVRKTRSLIMS
jgi:glucose-1-phosphate adenylyltransferase